MQGNNSQSKFIASIKKVRGNRNYKITNSIGVYDAYKWIRKNNWLNIGTNLSEHDFYSIIRSINNALAKNLIAGSDIIFPYRMGRLELRKYNTYVNFNNNKLNTNKVIDWNKTLHLWYEDPNSYNNRTLVRTDNKEVFKVFYNRTLAEYINKSFYEFKINRNIKQGLKNNIVDNKIDAFNI